MSLTQNIAAAAIIVMAICLMFVSFPASMETKEEKKEYYFFAIDGEEIIVSDSPKGSNKVNFIERIKRQDNDILYNAVVTLTSISKSPDFDMSIFKAMDKVCQLMYNKSTYNHFISSPPVETRNAIQ